MRIRVRSSDTPLLTTIYSFKLLILPNLPPNALVFTKLPLNTPVVAQHPSKSKCALFLDVVSLEVDGVHAGVDFEARKNVRKSSGLQQTFRQIQLKN